MRVAWLQAVDFESLGTMEPWLRQRGHEVSQISLWKGDPVPAVQSFDLLIATGGAFVPTDERHYPWMSDVLELFRSAVSSGRRVFGVCLGAQLLAHALGANIRRNAYSEIGWHPVRLSAEGTRHRLMRDIPSTFVALHWHQDMFELPSEGALLASSEACPHQAFALGSHVLGVQFHPEISPQKARSFVQRSPPQNPGRYVQDDHEVLAAESHFTDQSALMNQLLSNLLE